MNVSSRSSASSSSTPRDPSRRQFLGQASCAAVGSTALFSTLLNLRLANSLAAQVPPAGGDDYRALVCLFLAGGNDSYNMLVPTSPGEYEAYARVRGNLALERSTLLPIAADNLGGRALGLHPSMPELHTLFNDRRAAFVANVGSLLRPTTLADVQAGRHLPLSLYSHADQVKQWQTCMPDARTAIGWGGRAADILNSLNTPSHVSMNISLAGENAFLTGRDVVNYSVTASGATALRGYQPGAVNTIDALRTAGVNSQLGATYRNLFEQTYARTTRGALDAYDTFSQAINATPPPAAAPAGNQLASSLAMVARIIAARQRLQVRRQVFFVLMGGWDHHDEVLNNQRTMLRVVSQAVNTFWQALGESNARERVTLFTASDFARTLTSNGNGSDHAWGGHHFVLGGAVRGGRVYGNAAQGIYPDLRQLPAFDTSQGQGRIVPGVSVDEYARDLLSWFGVSAGDMDYVLPAFSSRFGGRPGLGLFG